MADVYLETSFVSACVTSRNDVSSAYRRQVSLDWWHTQRARHETYVSAEVIRELSSPAYPNRDSALRLIDEVPLLPITLEVEGFAQILVREKAMPVPVAGDAIHVAVAAVHGIDFLLSWNVRHLANPNKMQHIQAICMRAAVMAPRIITPDLLWEMDDEPTE